MKLLSKALPIAVMVGVMLSLTGCGPGWEQFKPLPDEERYQFINPVKDALDIETAGEVLEAEYDNGGGVISPSWFSAEVQGEDAFRILTERLMRIPDIDCSPLSPSSLKCRFNQAEVSIQEPYSDNIVYLLINDSYNGRTSE